MRVLKKGLVIVLALVVTVTALFPALQQVFAAEFILDPSALSGGNYTASEDLAGVLDQIFAGDIDVYSDRQYAQEVSMPVGTYMSNSTLYYVQSKTTGNPVSGWQCYIYGNGVYNKLFHEWVGHGTSFSHSQVVVPGGINTASYELFRDAGVRCGAYLRTTGNSDGSYSSNVGHSMIILSYDTEAITYLEGNADGNGLIRVTIRTWSDFNTRQLSGRGRYISHIVQPTDLYYDALYPVCKHEAYDDFGVCGSCGEVFDWSGTLDPWAQGIYRLTEQVTPRADAPYDAATASNLTLAKDQKVRTTGQYRNAFEQIWYSIQDEKGNTFYVNGECLEFVEYPALEVTCTGFSPVNGAVLEQKSYPVKGTVTANFPLKSVSGYLDGELYATWTAGDENTAQVDIRQTDINKKLTFSKLEGGRHTVKLKAQSFVHDQPVTVHESEFFTISPETCSHSYVGRVTKDATCTEDGVLTYTCSTCKDTYTRTVAAYGHDYQDGVCSYCSDRLPLSNLSGAVISSGQAGEPVKITLTQDDTEVYTVTESSGAYTITEILPGTYLITVTKAGCVPLSAELTLEPGDTVFDVKICAPGDVNGDGYLKVGDISKIYAHIRNAGQIEDAYELLCADYNGDGMVNIGDILQLYDFIRQPQYS